MVLVADKPGFNMLKVALLVVIIFNAFLPWSVADKSVALELPNKNLSFVATKKKPYSLSNFSLGGVAVEMTEEQVLKKLGIPREKKEFDGCVTTTMLEYDRLSVSISSADWSVSTSNPLYKTDLGIKVGDSIARARKIYNRVMRPAPNQRPGVLEYREAGAANLQMDLLLGYRNGKITSIEYAHYYKEDC
jgi:hypothetical protein